MNVDFLGKTKLWLTVAAILVTASVLTVAFKGLHFGIEFKGGTEIIWNAKNIELADVRSALKTVGLEKSIIQKSGDSDVLIRTPKLNDSQQAEVQSALEKKLGGKLDSIQSVGAAWGREITRTSVIALLLSMAGLLAYISIRFEYKMAVSAIIALTHDILFTVGVYALVGREVSPATIAALLTILGYSLYDTIVVFHRIVENEGASAQKTYTQIANDSLNQVLVRSINTSITTLVPVLSLFILGGAMLRDFAFALLVGISIGTFSTIFIATPIIALWKDKEHRYVLIRKKLAKKAAVAV